MPIKDLTKKREYQKKWVAHKRSQSNVELKQDNQLVEPLKRGWGLFKCPACPRLIPMEKKYGSYFAPICSGACVRKRQTILKKTINHESI